MVEQRIDLDRRLGCGNAAERFRESSWPSSQSTCSCLNMSQVFHRRRVHPQEHLPGESGLSPQGTPPRPRDKNVDNLFWQCSVECTLAHLMDLLRDIGTGTSTILFGRASLNEHFIFSHKSPSRPRHKNVDRQRYILCHNKRSAGTGAWREISETEEPTCRTWKEATNFRLTSWAKNPWGTLAKSVKVTKNDRTWTTRFSPYWTELGLSIRLLVSLRTGGDTQHLGNIGKSRARGSSPCLTFPQWPPVRKPKQSDKCLSLSRNFPFNGGGEKTALAEAEGGSSSAEPRFSVKAPPKNMFPSGSL